MGRIIALALISGGIWWLWRRWQSTLNQPTQGRQQSDQPSSNPGQPQRLSQCQRCDAMLPSTHSERTEVAQSCEHGDRCPLRTPN